MNKIKYFLIAIFIFFVVESNVYALNTQQTITNETLKTDLNLTINYEDGKWVKFSTEQQQYGIKFNIESNTGTNTNYSYTNSVKISIFKIGSKVYYFQNSISDNTKDMVLYSDSYELVENNNYLKTTGLKIYNGTVPNYGQVRYYDFTNDRFSDTYGGMNNFSGEGILYYSNINCVVFTNDNTPNSEYNNYSKIYNFNLETPEPEPEPIILKTIDITQFFIIDSSELNRICESLNIAYLTTVDGEYLETLIIANIFAYFIIILFIICLIKVTRLIFRKRRKDRWY